MNFQLDDDQRALQEAARGFLADRASQTAQLADLPERMTPELWSELVELGWVGLLAPSSVGGAGAGLLEMMVVLEEMGRVPLPGPFFSSAVLATRAAAALGLTDQLSALVSGASRGTVAIDESGHGDPVTRIRTRASRKSGRWRLSGTKPVVLDAVSADWVLVPARTQEGIGTFLVEGPTGTHHPSLDVTRAVSRIDFDQTPAESVGPSGDHTEIWRRVVDDGAVALCAETLGVMQASFDLAINYAQDRVQFGRPIAKFQATKHKAAELLERIELTRVGVHHAAWASDTEAPNRREAVAMVAAFAPRAANELTGEGIQIHGGVGFTWDCDAHLYYRRAKGNDLLLGAHGAWRAQVADSYLGPA